MTATNKLFGETITSIHVTDGNRVIRIRVKEKWQLDRILKKLYDNLEMVE
jgi:ribosome-interacting GTPase 1